MRVSQALTDVDFGLILAKNTERTPRSFLFHFKKLKPENFPFMRARKNNK